MQIIFEELFDEFIERLGLGLSQLLLPEVETVENLGLFVLDTLLIGLIVLVL
jgi:hypothetical protein